jgi:hypothetical protein
MSTWGTALPGMDPPMLKAWQSRFKSQAVLAPDVQHTKEFLPRGDTDSGKWSALIPRPCLVDSCDLTVERHCELD